MATLVVPSWVILDASTAVWPSFLDARIAWVKAKAQPTRCSLFRFAKTAVQAGPLHGEGPTRGESKSAASPPNLKPKPKLTFRFIVQDHLLFLLFIKTAARGHRPPAHLSGPEYKYCTLQWKWKLCNVFSSDGVSRLGLGLEGFRPRNFELQRNGLLNYPYFNDFLLYL